MVLPILIGGLFGFTFLVRGRQLTHLLVLVILTRTAFLAYHYSPEARYIVEAYPAMIAACGVTGAALWNYLNRRWRDRRRDAENEARDS